MLFQNRFILQFIMFNLHFCKIGKENRLLDGWSYAIYLGIVFTCNNNCTFRCFAVKYIYLVDINLTLSPNLALKYNIMNTVH